MNEIARLAAVALVGAVAGCATRAAPPPDPLEREAEHMADVMAGRFAQLSDDPRVAADRSFAAFSAVPDSVELFDAAIASALIAGDVPLAARAASVAAERGLTSPLGNLARGVEAFAADEPAEAAAWLDGFAGGGLDRIAAQIVRGWALAADGREEAAAAALPPDQGPLGPLFDVHRGVLAERQGRTEAALAFYERATGPGVRLAVAEVLQGALLEREGRRADAIAGYRAFLVDLDAAPVRAALVRAEAGQAPPNTPSPREAAALGLFTLAAALAARNEPREQISILSMALRLDPKLDAALLAVGGALARVERQVEARAAWARLSPGSPYYAAARIEDAWLWRAQDRPDEAIAAARSAVEAGGGVQAQRALADIQRTLENWVEAEAGYAALIAEAGAGASWELYFARGAARERLGRWPEAEADLQQALALSPGEPEVLNYLGYTWVDRGVRLEEGLGLIRQAVEARPDAGHITDSLGWALFRLGRFDEALTHLEEAVALLPDDPTINDHLGDAYWRLGRRAEARFQWRRALDLDPPARERAELERKLNEGLDPPALAPAP